MQWHKPQIETIFSIDEITFADGKCCVIKDHIATGFEDARPGRKGRRAPMALIKRPDIGRLFELFTYDRETGDLRWRKAHGRAKIGELAGDVDKGRNTHYRRVRIGGSTDRAHMIAWAMSEGVWPDQDIDHKNGDGIDNRISNLRETTQSQNHMNTLGKVGRSKGTRLELSNNWSDPNRL